MSDLLEIMDIMDSLGGSGGGGGGSSLLSGLQGIMAAGSFVAVVLVVLGIGVIAAMYALDGFQVMHAGRKSGLEKDWMAFVPFAHTIYRLSIVGEQWWKMFFLEWYALYAWIVYQIIVAVSNGKWSVFATVLITLYLLCCLAYNIYYMFKYYKAFGIQPVLCILVGTAWFLPAVRIIDLLIAFTDNFAFTGEGTSRTIAGTAKAVVNVRQGPSAGGAAQGQAGSITGLSGMYAGQDFPLAANDEMIIGRDSAMCNVIVDQNAEKVSRKHCGVVFDASRHVYQVTDYSTNGTFVDGGNRLVANMPTTLQRGTVIALGSRENRFKLN